MMLQEPTKLSINKSSSNHKLSSTTSKEEKEDKMAKVLVAIDASDFEYLKKQDGGGGGAFTKYTDICAR